MSPTRRDFIKTTAATAAAIAAGPGDVDWVGADRSPRPAADPLALDLAKEALDAARSAGASYADVRVGRYRRQTIATRERQVSGVSDNESYGIGVRTLVNGCWGFAATSAMNRAGTRQAALEAVTLSKAARAVQKRRVEFVPVTPVVGTWITPVRQDPLEVAIEDKIALLLAANEAALKVKEVRFVNSGLALLREVKTLLTSEGTNVTQTMIRVGPAFSCTAISGDDFQTLRRGAGAARAGLGVRRITRICPGNAERWASSAAEKLRAKSVEAGSYDLILEPTNLWLTIHESIGHATELDRAIGEEANYAGTSFVAPPEKMLGQLRYGPDFMNVQADRTQEGSLSQVAWDDEGRAGGQVVARRTRSLQGLPDDARAGRANPEAHRREPGRMAARSPSHGMQCSFSACPTCRCCPASATSASRTSSPIPSVACSFEIAARGRSITSATISSSPGRRSTKC